MSVETLDPLAPATMTLDSERLEFLRRAACENLFFFAKGVLGFRDMSVGFHKPLCELLQNDEIPDKLCILPRGTFKTSICTVAFPLWRAIRDPNITILIVQNTHKNALAKLAKIRAIVETNPLFRLLFPEVLPTKENVWRGDSLCLTRSQHSSESTFECAGVGTGIVGRHYDIIIEDDTVSPDLDEMGEENLIPSKDDIGQAIGYHNLLYPILKATGKPQNLVVGTRWFERDLISHIKSTDKGFHVYERAARETDGRPAFDGEPTFPEVFGNEKLERIERKLGPYLFSCLYMNQPVRSEDMVFKPEWISYYDTEPLNLLVYTTCDSAGDPEESLGKPDYNVVMTCGKDLKTGVVYVLEYFHERCNPGKFMDAMFSHAHKYFPLKVGLQTFGEAQRTLYYVRQRMLDEKFHFMIEPLHNTRRSKNAGIMALQPLFLQGKVKLRPHMKALVQELLSFPLGANDDLADVLAMQQDLWMVGEAQGPSSRERALDDPFSLDSALAELDSRRASFDGIVYDSMGVDLWN